MICGFPHIGPVTRKVFPLRDHNEALCYGVHVLQLHVVPTLLPNIDAAEVVSGNIKSRKGWLNVILDFRCEKFKCPFVAVGFAASYRILDNISFFPKHDRIITRTGVFCLWRILPLIRQISRCLKATRYVLIVSLC